MIRPVGATALTLSRGAVAAILVLSARRNEDDACQVVEEAVTRRALSTRSGAGQTYVGAVSLPMPASHTTIRRAESPCFQAPAGVRARFRARDGRRTIF